MSKTLKKQIERNSSRIEVNVRMVSSYAVRRGSGGGGDRGARRFSGGTACVIASSRRPRPLSLPRDQRAPGFPIAGLGPDGWAPSYGYEGAPIVSTA